MKKTHFKRATNILPITGYILGITLAALCSVTIIAILALFITNEYIDIKMPAFVLQSIHILPAFVGTLAAIKLVNNNVFATGAIVGVGYYILLLCVGMLLFNGISIDAIIGLICCLIGSTAAIVVDTAPKKKRYRTRRANRFC